MTRLLCFGDVHIGSGLSYPDRLADHERVLEQIFQLARDRDVDGILFAGDLFEGPSITPQLLDVFMRPFEQLQGEIPLLAISGNSTHDLAMRGVNALAPLRHLPGITVCSTSAVHDIAGCSVAVLPWVHPGRLIARAGRDVPRDEINQVAADLLVQTARDLRAGWCRPEGPAILLGHWSVSGTALPTGLPVDDLREPVLPVEALEALGYDALVFGHIHRSQPIGETGFYTGSPLPLNFGEAHVEHGVYILELSPDVFEGMEYEFVPVDSPRFVTLDYDVDLHLLEHDLASGMPLSEDAIVRVRFTATSEQMRRIDVPWLRASLLEGGARFVKVEPSIVREQRARVVGVSEEVGVLDALDLWLDSTGQHGDRELLRSRAALYLETVA